MRRRVLVCDDDPRIRRALEVLLTDAGFRPFSADSAEQAVKLVSGRTPDVAVVDLGLPGEDGIWLCEQLRGLCDAPILVLSVLDEEVVKVRALEAGADDYVTKPFGNDELVARLRALLRRSLPQGPESVLTADGLEVDLEGSTVRRDGELIKLTPTELRLLDAMVRDRGRLLTHRRLLTAVWGLEQADDVYLLRVQMANLRRKVELDPARPSLIVTEPGLGYRFVA